MCAIYLLGTLITGFFFEEGNHEAKNFASGKRNIAVQRRTGKNILF